LRSNPIFYTKYWSRNLIIQPALFETDQ
jgi:hypothetical protein